MKKSGKLKNLIKNTFKFIIALPIVFTLFAATIILIFRFINPPVSAFMLKKSDISFEQPFYNNEQKHEWVNLNNISRNLTLAVIASEDQKFLDHFGFDIEQIEKAINEMDRGRRIRGASTISQQVVKNLFLSGEKNFIRKAVEAELTLLVELLWSKRRIIEVYLNIAEFGRDVFGAEAAAKYFYKKNAKKLTRGQAAMLAAVLPSPARYSVNYPSGRLINRQARVLRFMEQIGGTRTVQGLYDQINF